MSINETIQKHSSHPLASYSSRPYPVTTTALLPRRHVIYCGACGMPPEYCPFGPDFETHCDPWLAKHHAEFRTHLIAYLGSSTQTTTTTTLSSSSSSSKINNNKGDKHKAAQGTTNTKVEKTAKPDHPWTTMERLTAFYHKYAPDKIDGAAAILDKYAGKEEQLFRALVQKYGPEAQDPYFSDSEDDDDHVDDDEEEEDEQESNNDHDDNQGQGQEHVDAIGISKEEKKKRRGAGAKKLEDNSGGAGSGGTPMRVVIQKVAQKKKRNLTVVTGLETARHLKLKDVAKVLSKKFAGSSSVKDDNKVIVQGDHTLELAELLVDKFAIPETALWLDMGDGEVVPFR